MHTRAIVAGKAALEKNIDIVCNCKKIDKYLQKNRKSNPESEA